MGLNGGVLLYFIVVTCFSTRLQLVSPALPPVSTPPLQSVNWAEDGDTTKFHLRKCCGVGQVYASGNSNHGNATRRCIDYGVSSHPASTLIEISQQLFFYGTSRDREFEIDAGFPRNCSSTGLMLLEPEAMLADRFYPLANGQLVVPHRFWIFEPDHHCMEDFFFDGDFNKVKRSAIICTDHIVPFPANVATDGKGQLNLAAFIPAADSSSGLVQLDGRKIVRKCCDLNEVYAVANHSCIPKQGYATQYFDDLLSDDQLFFRVGLLDCPDQQQAPVFQLTPSGDLRIKMDDMPDDSDWQVVTEYCLDDFVVFFDDELPETINLASFCPDRRIAPVPEVPTEPTTLPNATVYVPKCCPLGQVMEGGRCQPFRLGDKADRMAESMIVRGVEHFSLADARAVLVPNSSLHCRQQESSYPLLAGTTYALATPLFRPVSDNHVSLSLHYYVPRYWDLNVTLQPYCVDLEQFRTPGEVYYEPTVWYCTSPSHVSGHYPILLYISSFALAATFIIYFLIPASGAARFVTSLGGSRSKQMSLRRRPVVMATMLTGRNLLCHVFTLMVTFVSLAIGQQEIVMPGQDACTALGYVIYSASMASFAWLTVYCFDYCWMFRGSFKVSDTMLFVPYSIFGWGVPLVTVTIATLAQFNSASIGFLPSVNPNMGLVRCWFAGETSALVFFYIPVSLLLVLNFAFFIRLLFNPNVMNCTKRRRTSGTGPQLRINRKGSNSTRQQDDLKMAVKLFFIAGIPWVFEIMAWLPNYLPNVSPVWRRHTIYLFEVSNLLNSLRGVIVFIIFVLLQRDARRHLWNRIKKLVSAIRRDPSSSKSVIKGDHPHPNVAGSLSALSASSQRTLQSQLSSISASSDTSDHISYTSGEGEPVVFTPPFAEPDEITYL